MHGYFWRQKCRPRNVVFSDISFMAILAGYHPSDSVKVRHSPLASENLTNQITWKWCKIGRRLVLITNRKSYMGFRLVPKLVILNDLERRNGHYIALFHWIWWTYFPTRNRRVDMWWNLCTSLLYSVVGVRCRRIESSRSLSHLLMSFLYAITTNS